MRRIDDGHVPRQTGAPPFRVLGTSETFLSPPTAAPPPPRAPEPYKVVPSTMSFGRARRRSSFVIIAETRPTTPDSRSPSPTLGAGRVSPFRGRGFKGPPPRSKSRPQSPENDERKRGKNDRRASVSQQNSPRRSLIPQPTRQRSTSLTKANDRPSSPKIGQRVDSKSRLNITDSRTPFNDSRTRSNISRVNSNSTGNLSSRRQLSRTTNRLSPIQGTPTKPEKPHSQSLRRNRSRDPPKISPAKTPRHTSPPKSVSNQVNSRRIYQDKTSSKERLVSPSKIPLKTNKYGSTSSLNSNRFISKPETSGSRKNDKYSKDSTNSNDRSKDFDRNVNSEPNSNESQASDKTSSNATDDLVLLSLLKQSLTATGTSSVVSTTATTAVQPLHIDANAVLIEKDVRKTEQESRSERKSGTSEQSKTQSDVSMSKSSNSYVSKDESPAEVQVGQSSGQRNNQMEDNRSNPQAPSRMNKAGNNYRTKTTVDSKNASPVGTDSVGGHSKNSSISQSVKNYRNGVSNGSASQRSRVQSNDQNSRNSKANDQKIEDLPAASTYFADGTNEGETIESRNNRNAKAGDNKTVSNRIASGDNKNTVSNRNASGVDNKANSNRNLSGDEKTRFVANGSTEAVDSKTVLRSINDIVEDKTNSTASMTNSVTKSSMNASAVNASNVNSAGVRTRNENRGSNVSLKSSMGVSTDSIESVRSADTGVSVDTVRGVSSPREKTGMHVVKRAQEIETLSGNIMHLEQNGEPAVPAGGNEKGNVPERLLTRWRRSLDRYCRRCPSMRCLACRRDAKGVPWPRNQTRPTMRGEAAPPVASEASDAPQTGCWPKFKTRCRCTNFKCCMRTSRVAPAEATVCCPPERRCGAICRRLFSCCSCKRAEEQRTRSIRAKHSLTSVAPPPLSEEPKAKIPDVLVEHNSVMRGAIPCLPVPLAWFCLVWNVLLPGSGTVWSGLFNLCMGQPRFSPVAGLKSRLGAFIVNLVVGVGQMFTVLFCLVGWGWSIWWGVTMVRLARKYKRFKASEAASGDPEARGGEPTALPPGVPSQALREMERAR